MEFYLDLLLYAPYVTAGILCLITFCFYLDSKYVVYQHNSYTTSLDLETNKLQSVIGKRRRLITFIYRKRPTKESVLDEEDSSIYFAYTNQ
ncbi:hypothetical protein AB685_13635 [Bacillus sp. LL01]|uniref:hypothetical protein n=1 Tax=Bacillus sp. LL01 TaxID=1665556 RepID=UPI00064D0AAD|nr:hypothetical protein [Bacillus sp. LL01]KMJ57878.1 hypothetical protein AB685_13635 [Bacillus sp. LL01]